MNYIIQKGIKPFIHEDKRVFYPSGEYDIYYHIYYLLIIHNLMPRRLFEVVFDRQRVMGETYKEDDGAFFRYGRLVGLELYRGGY